MTHQKEYKVFHHRDLFLNDDDPETAYRRRKDDEKTALSWGQRKLLLVLIQFLTLFWDPKKVKSPVVVYAGAAPGIGTGIASLLFPEVEFHLYDPAPFKVKASKRIHLYQDYFTDEIAEQWAIQQQKDNNVYFISDIRTADYTTAKNLDENEKSIWSDMELQMKWHKIIQPVQSQLKFRLPYTGGNRPETVNYLVGYLFKQAWAPQTSTESRLVPTYGEIEWSCLKYQSQMFHHNVVIRERYEYANPYNNQISPVDSPELMNDWDSRCETQIIMDYLVKRTGKSEERDVISLSRLFTYMLTKDRKYKDTLSYLRAHPRAIKNRNFGNKRDNLNLHKPSKPDDILTRIGIIT